MVRAIKAKRCKTRVGCRFLECFLQCFSSSFPRLVRILLYFVKNKNYVYTRLPHMDINVAVSLWNLCWCSHAHLLCKSSWQFLARSLQSSTILHFVFPQHICLFSSWMELNLKVPSHIFENLQNMCIICDKILLGSIFSMYVVPDRPLYTMPWWAQYGRWNFLRDTNEVHRIG